MSCLHAVHGDCAIGLSGSLGREVCQVGLGELGDVVGVAQALELCPVLRVQLGSFLLQLPLVGHSATDERRPYCPTLALLLPACDDDIFAGPVTVPDGVGKSCRHNPPVVKLYGLASSPPPSCVTGGRHMKPWGIAPGPPWLGGNVAAYPGVPLPMAAYAGAVVLPTWSTHPGGEGSADPGVPSRRWRTPKPLMCLRGISTPSTSETWNSRTTSARAAGELGEVPWCGVLGAGGAQGVYLDGNESRRWSHRPHL